LNIIKNKVDAVTVLDIQGVIKLGESAREFSSFLEKVLNDDTGPVMINFEAINYMDSTGLGELIGYLQKFEDRQRKMALVKPSHRILALLKITKLDTVFKIFDSRESALAYLNDTAALLSCHPQRQRGAWWSGRYMNRDFRSPVPPVPSG
jgi:anti-anti-sigma factor